jgi:hypothetical protein
VVGVFAFTLAKPCVPANCRSGRGLESFEGVFGGEAVMCQTGLLYRSTSVLFFEQTKPRAAIRLFGALFAGRWPGLEDLSGKDFLEVGFVVCGFRGVAAQAQTFCRNPLFQLGAYKFA